MTTDVVEGAVATHDVEYASLWRRFMAFAIDLMIACLVVFAFVIILPIVLGPRIGVPRGDVIVASFAFVCLIVTWLYWALMESSSKQSTIGKALLGMVVTDVEGRRLSFAKATVRHFGKMASALIVLAGFIMIGFTARRQGLHDMITGSLVVMKQQQDDTLTPASSHQTNLESPSIQR
jgi:uncharacterized RDD family membrane protein YckC